MTQNLLTPRLSHETNERAAILLDDGDMEAYLAQGKRPGWTLLVRDQFTGRRLLVAGAPCELPQCHCDAVVLKEVPEAP